MLVEVAVVAVFETFNGLAIIANLVSVIVASRISSLTIVPFKIFSEVTASTPILETVTAPSEIVVEKVPFPVPVTAPSSTMV